MLPLERCPCASHCSAGLELCAALRSQGLLFPGIWLQDRWLFSLQWLVRRHCDPKINLSEKEIHEKPQKWIREEGTLGDSLNSRGFPGRNPNVGVLNE